MLITPVTNRRNRIHAFAAAASIALASIAAACVSFPAIVTLALCPPAYWLVRRRCLRRLRLMQRPFPTSWEMILQSHVAFFRALPDEGKERFRQLVRVFLDEVRITGIRTDVD